ncbi:MAG: ABC transporter family substrate-binding protein [Pseudolysinimonas sp.]|uniref:ABC transporter family substrate-binding protein n=1 Tax=Pseudolysinimonas sp. TaxID=2680009 RepID=UPI003266292B
MRSKRLVAAGAVVLASAIALSGCTPPRASEIVAGTNITVAMNDVFSGYNTALTNLNSLYNAQVAYMALDGFSYYDDTPNLVKNTDFGTYAKTSDDPLTVKYTINPGVKWSDGTAVDGADMLLYWASITTHRTDGKAETDEDTGAVTSQTGTFWNTGAAEGTGFDLVSAVPTLSDDNRSMTVVYDKPYADWELVSPIGVSAHGTVQMAYPGKYDTDAAKAKSDLIKAVQDADYTFLAPVSKSYNNDYTFNVMPDAAHKQALLSNYAYTITGMKADDSVTLTANPNYTWGPSPKFQTITVRAIPDSQAQLTALQNGEIQIAAGQPTPDIAAALAAGIPNVAYVGASEGSFEHVDLQVTNGGPFDPASYGGDAKKALAVRQAFLKTIPRQDIIDKLVKPLQSNAEVMNSLVFFPGTDGADKAAAVNGLPELEVPDTAGAKQILTDAGITTPVDVRLLFSQTNTRRNAEYGLWAPIAAEAGFNLINASSTTWSGDLDTKQTSYDAALFAWILNNTGRTQNGPNYITKGANNYYGWSDPDVDAAFKAIDTESDGAKADSLLVDAEKAMGAQAWTVPIFQFPGLTAWDESKVSGVTAMPITPQYFWNFWKWTPVGVTASPAAG